MTGTLEKSLGVKENLNYSSKDIAKSIKNKQYGSYEDFFKENSKIYQEYDGNSDKRKLLESKLDKKNMTACELLRANYKLNEYSALTNFREIGDAGDMLFLDKVETIFKEGMKANPNIASVDDITATTVYEQDSDVPTWKPKWSDEIPPELEESSSEGWVGTTTITREKSEVTIIEYKALLRGNVRQLEKIPMNLLTLELRKMAIKNNNKFVEEGLKQLITSESNQGTIIDTATHELQIKDAINLEGEMGDLDFGNVWIATKEAWKQYKGLDQVVKYLFFQEYLKKGDNPSILGALPKRVSKFPGVGKESIGLLSKDTGLLLHTERRGNMIGSSIDITQGGMLNILLVINMAFQRYSDDAFKFHTLT